MDAKTLMMWDGQGPVSIGTFDLEKGRPESGYLVDVYRIGCGTSQLSTTLSVEKRVVTETCSGQRLPLAERETSKTLEVTLAMVQFSGRTLAAALYGEAVTQASGTVTVSVNASAGGSAAVTFPVGLFTAADLLDISLTKLSGGLAKYIPYAAGISATGMTVGLYSGDGSTTTASVVIQWRAEAV